MYIGILVILLLYGCIVGESDDRNSSRTHLKTDIKPNHFSNHSIGSDIPSVKFNSSHGTATTAHVAKISKLVAPIRDNGSNESSDKVSLREDEHAKSEIKLPLFFISKHSNDEIKNVLRNDTSYELLQADGTYPMQHYMHPMQNPYYRQQSSPHYNWQQVDYNYNSRNDPCASYSAPHQYMHPNHYNRGFHSQYDPYQAQGTYNMPYYVPFPQQANQYHSQNFVPFRQQANQHHSQNVVPRHTWNSMDYNSRQFVNPCIPRRPVPPPTRDPQSYLYPNPPKPRHHHSYQLPYNSHPPKEQTFVSPPPHPHVYNKMFPPQKPFPPPETFTYPKPPPEKTYFTTTRKTKIYVSSFKPTPGWKRTPSVTPYAPVTRRRTTPRSRTKSYTPVPPYSFTTRTTKNGRRTTVPPCFTTTRKTNGCRTPPGRITTPTKPNGRKTPPGRITTPKFYTPPTRRTKGYTY